MRAFDSELAAAVYVVIGLDLVRQPGQFSVAGVAALAVRGTDWQPQWRVHARVGRAGAADASEAAGLRTAYAQSAGEALALVERRLTTEPHTAVARIGRVEAAILRAERASCPRLASLMMWDSLRLAQLACPSVQPPSADGLAAALGVDLPGQHAQVTQQVWATAQILHRAMERGVAAGLWFSLAQLEELVGTRPPAVEEQYLQRGPVQESLFD